MSELLYLAYTFLKIGFLGFGGGYAMLSMIFTESEKLSITAMQFADLNALDMIVPGPIAINAATYVGYLNSGITGAIVATLSVMLPSFILIILAMHFLTKYKNSKIMNGVLAGVKPAAVGLIAAAALIIGAEVILISGKSFAQFISDPLGTVSLLMVGIFAASAFLNIKFKINPIIITLAAGVVGAIFAR